MCLWLWLGWRGVALFGGQAGSAKLAAAGRALLSGAGVPVWGLGGGWEGELGVVVGDAEVGETRQVNSGCSGGEPDPTSAGRRPIFGGVGL